jgi:hypothetical protein
MAMENFVAIDRNVIRARMEVIADAVNRTTADPKQRITDAELYRAMELDDDLIAFCMRHNQSIDYVVLGDVRNMIVYLKKR